MFFELNAIKLEINTEKKLSIKNFINKTWMLPNYLWFKENHNKKFECSYLYIKIMECS